MNVGPWDHSVDQDSRQSGTPSPASWMRSDVRPTWKSNGLCRSNSESIGFASREPVEAGCDGLAGSKAMRPP
jgi:hypothetical protein